MKYVRGFLMAWGCFCWIPCPYKKWNEEDRPAMLAMLPLVGTFIGVITGLVWLALSLMEVGPMLTAVIVAAAYFLLTGFIHLDGYMDCCDAILPRHPDMERRREILKDPHNGAFGIISLVIMMAIFIASLYEITDHARQGNEGVIWNVAIMFPLLFTVTRGMAASSVLSCKPMETSQYAVMSEDAGGEKYSAGIVTVIVALLISAIAFILEIRHDEWYGSAFVTGAYVPGFIAAMITGNLDRRALGGMNGDISGHMIVTGEMFGMLAAALLV